MGTKYRPRCTDCYKYMPTPGNCEPCKDLRRWLLNVRREQMAADTPAARAERARRIPIYARLVAANVELPTR